MASSRRTSSRRGSATSGRTRWTPSACGPTPGSSRSIPTSETHLGARWLFLRALGALFFSAFYSLAFQIRGLLGSRGLLPFDAYLAAVGRATGGPTRFWEAPTLLWLWRDDAALTALAWAGMAASVLLVLNLWPRGMVAACGALFLSFIAAAQDFASYQSDGMLLEAALLSFFLAPRGLRPGLGAATPPPFAARGLLVWEWFRIYFESGVVKLASGDPQWRTLTAMDHYYENGPLPTWIGWWIQQLPHAFHAATALGVLVVELGIVWMAFLPRPIRIACCAITSVLQVGIIATANYTFLNYLVLALGLLLLDDRALRRPAPAAPPAQVPRWRRAAAGFVLGWQLYGTVVLFPLVPAYALPAPLLAPVAALGPFRVANRYGLFAVMTTARYEIEFQGTRDGETWASYPFRYKPQDPSAAPGIYAPYHPRFEWNLWFASLGEWRRYPWVVTAEERLLEGVPDVLALFARDPFGGTPPRAVRAVVWQYWFTDPATKRATGRWWRREERGPYASSLEREADGAPRVRDMP